MQAPRRELDVGLDPGSPGSRPRLQAALNRCTTGAAPSHEFLNVKHLLTGYGTRVQCSMLLEKLIDVYLIYENDFF